jgi:hypothetical protein
VLLEVARGKRTVAGKCDLVFPIALCCLLALSALTLACSLANEEQGAMGHVVRDSAGVMIVENSAPIWEPGSEWRISELLTSIGAVEGESEYQLYYAYDATRLSDGTVAVANSGTSEIRFFDADGRFVQTVGRAGEGPGEFRENHGLRALGHWAGDTLYAWDLYAQTLSVFTRDGRFIRSNRLRNTKRMYFMSRMYGGGVFGDRTLALAMINPGGPRDRVDGLQSQIVRYVRFTAEGDSLVSFGEFTGSEWFVRYVFGGQGMTMQRPPFGRIMTARVMADRLYVGTGVTYEVAIYRPEATVAMLVRRAHTPVSVTDQLLDWQMQHELNNAPDDHKASLRRDLADMPVPEFLPPYRTIEIDVHSNLWVQEYSVGKDTLNEWSVFDSSGVWLGDVSLPLGFELLEIGSDYVLGKEKDELDVEYVKVYALTKP